MAVSLAVGALVGGFSSPESLDSVVLIVEGEGLEGKDGLCLFFGSDCKNSRTVGLVLAVLRTCKVAGRELKLHVAVVELNLGLEVGHSLRRIWVVEQVDGMNHHLDPLLLDTEREDVLVIGADGGLDDGLIGHDGGGSVGVSSKKGKVASEVLSDEADDGGCGGTGMVVFDSLIDYVSDGFHGGW